MALQQLVRVAVEMNVTNSNGTVKKFANSWTYRTVLMQAAFNSAGFWNAWQPQVWNVLAAQLTGGPLGATALHGLVDYPLDAVAPPDVFGGVTQPSGGGSKLPNNICVFMNLKTSTRGRYFVGSKRFGPISQGQQAGDEWTAGFIAAMNGVGNAMLLPVVMNFGGGLQDRFVPCVWSRTRWPPNSGVTPDALGDVVSFHVNKTLGSWRHRRERTTR